MRNELNREDFQAAINTTLSGLQPDPWLYQRIAVRVGEGEGKVKKRISAALVIALIITLIAAIAVAATLLSHQEVVEQVAIPLALENDGKIGVNESYSPEELAELVRVLNENGIDLDENGKIMKALQSGQGYYEEETIMEICRMAFGGNYYTWTLEEQDWFEGLMVQMGFHETHQTRKPGKDNMTYEAAEAFAFDILHRKYGQDLEVENRDVYRLERQFALYDENGEATWFFMLEPRDMTHGQYQVMFTDADPQNTFTCYADIPDWSQPYTGDELLGHFHSVYSYDEGKWPQAVWKQLHEMMQDANIEGSHFLTVCKGYQLTAYPEPTDQEITRDEAIRIGREALGKEKAVLDSAVLTEYEGKRSWLVGLIVYAADEQVPDENAGQFVAAVDSKTGQVQSIRKQTLDDDISFPFVPQAAYEKAREGLLTSSDYIRLASEAITKAYPTYDIEKTKSFDDASWDGSGHTVRFNSTTVDQGGASAQVSADGTVRNVQADVQPLNGDNIFQRYSYAYGYFGFWDQETWVKLGQAMESMDPTFYENFPLKMTKYPAEASVSIGHEKAQELAIVATGKRIAEVNTCVLVDAEPHPVWIMRLLTDAYDNPVIGIDAETGETVFTELYKTDYTAKYVLYSLPETWRKVELERLGAPAMAKTAVNHKFGDMSLDEPDIWLDDSALWTVRQEGLTVQFVGRTQGVKSYEVELDENGFILRCEEKDKDSLEPMPEVTEGKQIPVPTPRPDGKPWFWGMDFGDEYFWAQFEAVMEKNDVSPANSREKEQDWKKSYGDDSTQWPYEYELIEYYFSITGEFEYDLGAYMHEVPIFPQEGKKTREEIYDLARAAFHREADPVMGAEWVDQMRCEGFLWKAVDERVDAEPYWYISMSVYEDEYQSWNPKGYVRLNEDGEILECMLDLMGNG